jgi:hypothetical protein
VHEPARTARTKPSIVLPKLLALPSSKFAYHALKELVASLDADQ